MYLTAAWELHHRVNRTGDEDGGPPLVGVPFGAVGVANEWAYEFAAQYALPTETTIGVMFERLNRHNPYVNQDYNERDRPGLWVAVTQKLGLDNAVSFGWAHAWSTPGDVGTRRSDGTTASGPVDNSANMLTGGIWHYFDGGKASVYFDYAAQINANGAHYDLGAVTHGIAYDGKESSDPTGRTFAGSTLQVASVGMTYNF